MLASVWSAATDTRYILYTMINENDLKQRTAVPVENTAPPTGVCPHCGRCPTCGSPHNPYANPYRPTWEWRPDYPYTQPYITY